MGKLKAGKDISKPTKQYLAKVFAASRSSLYYQPKLPGKDEQLKEAMLNVLTDNPAYGHRRIALALGVGRKRIRRIMKVFGIKPFKRGARFKKRRDERRPEAVFANEIKGGLSRYSKHYLRR